jgi:beta-lactamase class D
MDHHIHGHPSPFRRRTAFGAAALTISTLVGGTGCTASSPRTAPGTAVERTAPGLASPTPRADAPSATAQPDREPRVVVRDDLRSLFRKAGVEGTFALLDVEGGRMTVVDRQRAERRMIPASTFKIAHSLIALETGAAADADEVIPYGGKPQRIKEWEQDMNLRDAVRVSNVAVFQTLARRIGPKREKQWLDRLDYGNRRMGLSVEHFWLDGSLRISAAEQVGFLSRLARDQLPASPRAMRTTRDLLKVERKNGYTLYAKTGWGDAVRPAVGWWVGWVERGGRVCAFALNIDIKAGNRDADKRIPLARTLLQSLDILPAA